MSDPATGKLCCHLCGRWFVSLASHVRSHGYTADCYREAMGLLRTRGLVAAGLSARISARQSRAYGDSGQMRERFAVGQALARSGQLAWRARAADAAGSERLERSRRCSQDLATGREIVARRRQEQLDARLAVLGSSTLQAYLRTAYAAGANLVDLGRATGLGRTRLRDAVTAAGITVRTSGRNTLDGKRSRARDAEAAAAARVGTQDLATWLAQRHAAGWPLTRLAAAVGHSTPWVRWRLPAAGPQRECQRT